MSTTTLPADPDTERLAQKLAEATGKPLPTIVREAITAKAEAAGVALNTRKRFAGQDLIDRMTAISDHCAALPVLDPRSPEEIVGYDEFGVPN
jgi:antitoxin VapB